MLPLNPILVATMNVKQMFTTLTIFAVLSVPAGAQTDAAKGASVAEQQIVELEKSLNNAIQSQDLAQTRQFLADGYFLAVAVQGRPLQIVPREEWLENLRFYKIHSYTIDDMKVSVYGDTAVVVMLYTQKATVGRTPRDRSGQFLITDMWVKQKDGWRIAERHSSRPEQSPTPQPAP